MTEVMNAKKKTIILFLIALFILLLVDYSLKVREYNHLILANKIHEDTYSSWNEDTGILFSQCIKPGYSPEGRTVCADYISKSEESAGQLFVQNNQLKRFFVAPWHLKMRYAYEDLSAVIDNSYGFISGWEIEYDPNGSGQNLRNDFNYKFTETGLQYNQTLMEAKPFPGIFLRPTE